MNFCFLLLHHESTAALPRLAVANDVFFFLIQIVSPTLEPKFAPEMTA